MASYVLRFGSYYLIEKSKPNMLNPNGEQILNMVDQLAIAIDTESGAMFKAGGVEGVLKWANQKRKEGWTNIATITFPQGEEPIEVNRCLENSNYAATLYQKLQEQYGEPQLRDPEGSDDG